MSCCCVPARGVVCIVQESFCGPPLTKVAKIFAMPLNNLLGRFIFPRKNAQRSCIRNLQANTLPGMLFLQVSCTQTLNGMLGGEKNSGKGC